MTATNHGLFGAIIAITMQKYPLIAVAISPLSHFLLDAIPHFGLPESELKTKRFFMILGSDAFFAVVTTLLVAWAWQELALLVIVCAFLAASPDLMWIYYQYSGRRFKYKHALPKFHAWVQWSQTGSGLMAYTELLWFIIFFPLLIISGNR